MALSEYSFSPEIPPFSNALDRRFTSRQAERLRCWCETTGRDFYVRCLDLGRDGLFLQTLADLSPGTRMDIEIGLPGGDFAAHAEWSGAALPQRTARRRDWVCSSCP